MRDGWPNCWRTRWSSLLANAASITSGISRRRRSSAARSSCSSRSGEQLGRHLFLHQRDAHTDFIAMLRAHPEAASRGVLHCFTGGSEELEDCLALGLSIGVTGWICDERRGQGLREAAPRIPAERLMLETDAPYLLPRTIQPKPAHRRNEPAMLPVILEETARCRGEDSRALAEATTANACRFFGLTLGGPPGETPALVERRSNK